MKSISIIVPVYNELTLLESSIKYINSFLEKNFNDYEIIIVESGSNDGSAQKCEELAGQIQKIKLIRENQRNGFGSALKIGYKAVSKDLVWLITVDLPFDLTNINKALPLFEKYDCVLSYRSKDQRVLKRKVGSFFYNLGIKLLLGVKVKHINSAFKVYKRQVIQNMDLLSNGWFIDAEAIYNLEKNKIPYVEIPVELIDRSSGKSSVKITTTLPKVMKEMIFFLKNKKK